VSAELLDTLTPETLRARDAGAIIEGLPPTGRCVEAGCCV